MNATAILVWTVGLVAMSMEPTDSTVTVSQAGLEQHVKLVNFVHHASLAYFSRDWMAKTMASFQYKDQLTRHMVPIVKIWRMRLIFF